MKRKPTIISVRWKWKSLYSCNRNEIHTYKFIHVENLNISKLFHCYTAIHTHTNLLVNENDRIYILWYVLKNLETLQMKNTHIHKWEEIERRMAKIFYGHESWYKK